MSKARNGNRKCPNCKHFYAAHSYVPEAEQRPCVVPECKCSSLKEVKKP